MQSEVELRDGCKAPDHPVTMPDPLLAINDLSIERGERLLLDSFAMHIEAGEVVQIAGPNGAGKTSLMRVIAGLLEPDRASLSWQGQTLNYATEFSDEVLYLGHKPAVRDQLTPLENLQWFAQMHSQQTKNASDPELLDALFALGLEGYEHEYCSTLSAGQKRRVGLARLAVSKAPLWLLDEPFTAVDTKGVATLLGWIQYYATTGGSVFYTTHQSVEFSKLAPRVLNLSSLEPLGEL